jgi:hypothetical protein
MAKAGARGRPREQLRDALVHDSYSSLLMWGIAPPRAQVLLGRIAQLRAPGFDAFTEGGEVRESERPAVRGVLQRVLGGAALPGAGRQLGYEAIEKACKRHRQRFPMYDGPYDAARAWWRFMERHAPPFKPPRGKPLTKSDRAPWVSKGDAPPREDNPHPRPTTLKTRKLA